MRKAHHAANVEKMLAALAQMDMFLLRKQFRMLYGNEAPSSFSRQLLTYAVAYRVQAEAFGGPSAATHKQLLQLAKQTDGVVLTRTPKLVAGTRFMREWRGALHEVQILENGVLWNGTQHRSLSEVARAITGTHCSGPRFFGLRRAATTIAAKTASNSIDSVRA